MVFPLRFVAILIAWSLTLFTAVASADDAPSALPDRVEFNRDIRPILSDICYHCHGPDQAQRKADLRFDTEAGALADLGGGRHAIVPGKPDQSELIKRLLSTDPDERMPPPSLERQLTERQIALVRRWIEQGATWEAHWSFVKPVRRQPSEVRSHEWSKSPIDQFVLAKLEREGLRPSPDADRTILLRRVTLDLIGLPPEPVDVAAFLADESPDAFERVVDRLLASPRYGERMANRWLNAARYADTSGYQSDGERFMWRWRDWVIEAYNDNMPFDRFTVEQLAGDLLPQPTLDQQIATGFNRNHRGNAEGGIIPEEYACEYVMDRVETTATVWLGLTAMCARCHNHKYDPIAQQDFYQLYAFFNRVPEKGRAIKYGNSAPFIVSPTREQQGELKQIDRQLDQAAAELKSMDAAIAKAQAEWETGAVPDSPAGDAVRRGMILHYSMDGSAVAAVSAPSASSRPAGYLGQVRALTPLPTATGESAVETGEPQFAASYFGQGLACDGKHYAAVGDVANFGFFDKFSVAAWVRASDSKGGTIVSRMTDIDHGDGWCVVLEKGKLQVHLTKRWLDDACRVESEAVIAPEEWHHVVVTYDGSREINGIRIYIDGQPARTVSLLDELNQSFDNKGPLRIGGGNGPNGRFHGLIDEVRVYDRVVTEDESQILAQTDRLKQISLTAAEKRTPVQAAALRRYFVQYESPSSIRSVWDRYQSLLEARGRFVDELPTTMVMQDAVSRDAHILIRGEYDKPGPVVSANVPASLPALPPSEPRNRLGLAKWLVSSEQPLTARVAVNRLWQMLFGLGLVKTVDDFGQQGEWPSHPDLIDWLAVEFQSGVNPNQTWDTKRMLRMIVSSATYRQSSRASTDLFQRDPENRWLARGPRIRLSAEMIRDQALAASGLLVEQLGGPSIKPYQPDGLWKDLAGVDYDQDHGSKLYRRGLYIFWKRTVAPPSMINFDAAGRETCIVKETRTNTPLQALNLMNDVTYVEAARLLGERMMVEGDSTPVGRIGRAFQLVLGRSPSPRELAVLTDGYARHLAFYREHRADAEKLAGQGEYPRNAKLNPVELAACTTIAGLIFNLDETVMRE